MGANLREEIARARSGDLVCRDRIADRLARRVNRNDLQVNGSQLDGLPLGGPRPGASGNGVAESNGSANGVRDRELDAVLGAAEILDDLPDELPLDFRLQLTGPGQHLDGEERAEEVRSAGLLALLLLDPPSRDLVRARMYGGRTYYGVARDLGEDELQVGARYLRALRAWLELASGLLEGGVAKPGPDE